MATEWRETTLGEVTTWTSGGTPSKSNPAYWGGGIPWISAVSMKSGRLESSDRTLTEEGLVSGSRLAPKDSVLLLVRGSELHKRIPVGIATRDVAFNQDVKALRAREGLEPHFLYYWLAGNESLLLSKVEPTGIGAGKLETSVLKSLPLRLPPLAEQCAITHILGTLDDKIELNRKQNETLEAMARALFKAWFVDFEPVRAKMEGRWQRGQSLPGLPAHLYELFPDRLVESELGEIPEGWEWVPASRLIEFNPPEPLRKGTVAPYIEMSALPTSGSWPEPPVLRPFGSGMRFHNGDTLLARITPCLENGKTAFVQCLPDNEVGWGSTEFIVMRPRHPVPKEFGYLLARDEAFRAHAIRSMTGTSGRQRAQADSVANFPVAMPSNEGLWLEFARVVSPAFKSIKANAEAVETLAKLRDTLLPKLISGDLRVKDAERFMTRMEA